MRDLSALESIVDEHLEKRGASSVLGDAETTGGALARGVAYAAPFVGTGLSFADSYNDFKNGDVGWGLANLGFGILGLGSDVVTAISALGGPTLGLGLGQRAALGTAVSAARASRLARAARVAGAVGKGTLHHLPAAAVATAGEMVPVIEKNLQREIEEANAAAAAGVPQKSLPSSPEVQASVEGHARKGMAAGWNAIGNEEWDPFKKYRGSGLDGLHGYRARMRIPPKVEPIKRQFGDDRLSPGGPVW